LGSRRTLFLHFFTIIEFLSSGRLTSSSTTFHLLFGNRKIQNTNKIGLKVERQDVVHPEGWRPRQPLFILYLTTIKLTIPIKLGCQWNDKMSFFRFYKEIVWQNKAKNWVITERKKIIKKRCLICQEWLLTPITAKVVACALLLVPGRLSVYQKILMPRVTTMPSVLSRKNVLPAKCVI